MPTVGVSGGTERITRHRKQWRELAAEIEAAGEFQTETLTANDRFQGTTKWITTLQSIRKPSRTLFARVAATAQGTEAKSWRCSPALAAPTSATNALPCSRKRSRSAGMAGDMPTLPRTYPVLGPYTLQRGGNERCAKVSLRAMAFGIAGTI
jgi:hypothetical protein